MKDALRISLRSIGDVYLPGKFADAVAKDAPIKLFGPKELNQLNRIFNHLRRGGIAVASGSWEKILAILDYLEKKKREFASGERNQANRWYERHYQQVLSRVMVIAEDDRLTHIDPPIQVPYLLELLGEPAGANDGLPFLVPVLAIQKIQSDMAESYYIPALEDSIIAHSNVLPPISEATIELFHEALRDIEQSAKLPESPEILDMGCGCGCLSLLAAKIFAGKNAAILATDILPEAIATTRINVQRFCVPESAVMETTNGGDLFEPVGSRRFDLIIFNVPWVVTRPKSRAEMAICDEDQQIVRRFLTESPRYLDEGGHIVLGYSDHSGQKALENLEEMIGEAGFTVDKIFKRRTQSRSQKRKWEAILVYDLVLRDLHNSCENFRKQRGLSFGAWKDEDHPDLKTHSDMRRYINELRDRDHWRQPAETTQESLKPFLKANRES